MSPSSSQQFPDNSGHYGPYGGRYVPETLQPALDELEQIHATLNNDQAFWSEYNLLLREYAGRPTPLYFASAISAELGYNIYLKREDLNHTGAHKINNAIGQILLARKMGKTKLVAETGAGQHGVATATVAAKFNMPCTIFMGAEDMRRQALNVFRMELLGAEVIPVQSGTRTLKDATSEAIRYWVGNIADTHYLIGSVVGPHPYPALVRDFQAIIGIEARKQIVTQTGGLPKMLIACVGGGSNAIGLFHPFLSDLDVQMIGVEAAGRGLDSGAHAATLSKGQWGVLHGSASYLLQTDGGQVQLPHSISAGLDYPGVGPEHSLLKDTGRVKYISATDADALDAFQWLTAREGIIPALESAHALAPLMRREVVCAPGECMIVCLSGRGDKDVQTVAEALGREL